MNLRKSLRSFVVHAFYSGPFRFLNRYFVLQSRSTQAQWARKSDQAPWSGFYDYANSARNDDRDDVVRLQFLLLALQRIERLGIAGDVAELGVYRGNTAEFIRVMSPRHLHLFDTFTGFDSRDADGSPGTFSDTDLASVQKRVGMSGCTYYEGYFPESARGLDLGRRFALVHIDLDLEKPIRAALGYFDPLLSPGGVMVVHDYNNTGSWNEGARRAVDDFLKDHPYSLTEMPDHYGSVILTKPA